MISLTSNSSKTPYETPPSPLSRRLHSHPAIIPDILPTAMETQHSRVRRQQCSLHIPCFWTSILQSWCLPLQFREHLPRRRTASDSTPGPVVQRTQKSVGSLVSLYISMIIKLCFIVIRFRSCMYLFVFHRNVGDGERFMSASRGKSIITNNSRWANRIAAKWRGWGHEHNVVI